MLPPIINIAEEYGLSADPRTAKNKEVKYFCPFCKTDSNKYHLSLNTEANLFKCWRCGESGGVLKFEALLSNKSFEEVRAKYFGKRSKKLHPAYKLTPSQLKRIGWEGLKQEDFQNFIENKDKVYHDWKQYEYKELVKHYALLTLIAHYPIKEQQKYLYSSFLAFAKQSEVNNISEIILKEWNAKNKRNWALEATELARAIYKHALTSKDFMNMLANVLVAIEIRTLKALNNRTVSVSV